MDRTSWTRPRPGEIYRPAGQNRFQGPNTFRPTGPNGPRPIGPTRMRPIRPDGRPGPGGYTVGETSESDFSESERQANLRQQQILRDYETKMSEKDRRLSESDRIRSEQDRRVAELESQLKIEQLEKFKQTMELKKQQDSLIQKQAELMTLRQYSQQKNTEDTTPESSDEDGTDPLIQQL